MVVLNFWDCKRPATRAGNMLNMFPIVRTMYSIAPFKLQTTIAGIEPGMPRGHWRSFDRVLLTRTAGC